jgi:hypothetical protein
MRNPDRIKPFLEKIEKVWLAVPDWRFGQLMCNVLNTSERDPFYLEEEECLRLFAKMFDDVFFKEKEELDTFLKNNK